MAGVRGRASFLNWVWREHAPASCCVNPGESALSVYGGGGVGDNGVGVAELCRGRCPGRE